MKAPPHGKSVHQPTPTSGVSIVPAMTFVAVGSEMASFIGVAYNPKLALLTAEPAVSRRVNRHGA
jgi:hypothetical protein